MIVIRLQEVNKIDKEVKIEDLIGMCRAKAGDMDAIGQSGAGNLLRMSADKMELGVTGYMCLTDFEWELGNAKGGNKIYASEKDLRENCRCIPECGVAKVKVIGVETLQEPDFSSYE